MAGRFPAADVWWRHSRRGFSAADRETLGEAFGDRYLLDACYEAGLDNGVA